MDPLVVYKLLKWSEFVIIVGATAVDGGVAAAVAVADTPEDPNSNGTSIQMEWTHSIKSRHNATRRIYQCIQPKTVTICQ